MSRECLECGFFNIDTGKCSDEVFNCPNKNKAMTPGEYSLIQKLKEQKPKVDLIKALQAMTE